MYAVERSYFYLFASLTAISGLAGCASSSAKFAVQHPTRPAVSVRHGGNAPVDKAAARSADAHKVDLIGLDQQQIESRLGPPSRELQHSPAMEAVFRTGRCTLIVTFYPDVQTRIYHALAYRVVSDADSSEERRFCSTVFDARFRAKPAVDRTAYSADHGR
jgi:hypothetical protein